MNWEKKAINKHMPAPPKGIGWKIHLQGVFEPPELGGVEGADHFHHSGAVFGSLTVMRALSKGRDRLVRPFLRLGRRKDERGQSFVV